MLLEPQDTAPIDPLASARLESRCVLFATEAAEPPVPSVQRAEALADLLGVTLHVLRILPPTQALLPSERGDVRVIEQFIHAARESSRWCRDVLQSFVDDQLAVHVGGFLEQAVTCAEQMRAGLIVVPTGELTGTKVTELVRASGLPVLVAPPESVGHSTIVAATNLRNKDTPVLRLARALGRLRHAPVVAVHNMPLTTAVKEWITRHNSERVLGRERAREERQYELARVSAELGVGSAVLVHAPDPVQAIVREARAREADMVVVGTRARPRFARMLRKSVAAQLIDQMPTSVLVEPLPT